MRDGGRVSVALYLTDGRRPEKTARRSEAVFDARNHQPRSADLSDVAAYEAWRDGYLRDAHRHAMGDGGAAHTTAPPADDPGESARDAYIRRLGEAWKKPKGKDDPDDDGNDDAAAIEALNRRWQSPGATPGPGDARTRQTNDAAVADRDRARDEYVARISNAWRR